MLVIHGKEPRKIGLLQPNKFVQNMQAKIHRAYEWDISLIPRLSTDSYASPLILIDNSVMYLDGKTLKRATADGRVLWRINLERKAVSITGFEGQPLLTYADGTMQIVSIEGTFGESWQTRQSLANAPITVGEWLVFPTTNQSLVAFDADREAVVWQLSGIPPFRQWHVIGDDANFVLGLITNENEILTISHQGEVVDRALLRDNGSLTMSATGNLVAYTRGGLWQIDREGNWSLFMKDAPSRNSSRAVHIDSDSNLFLFDGQVFHAYDANQALLWQSELGAISGNVELVEYNNTLLLISTQGNLVIIRKSGGICNQVQMYGDDELGNLWHDLGSDAILRVRIDAQMMGFNWQRLLGGCV